MLLRERIATDSLCQCLCSPQSTRSARVDLAKHNLLELVVERQHTSTSNTTEDVRAGTLEEGLVALLGDNLGVAVEHGLVVNGTAGRHHHATTKKRDEDGISRS